MPHRGAVLARAGGRVVHDVCEDLRDLVGELEHQPFADEESRHRCAGVLSLEPAGGVPQQVLSDLGRAAHLIAVTAGGGHAERGVQGGQAPAHMNSATKYVVCPGRGVRPAAAAALAGPAVQAGGGRLLSCGGR